MGYQPFLFFLSFFFSSLARVSVGSAALSVNTEQVPLDGNTRLVSRYRRGAFRTVQAAVDSVPAWNKIWVRIHVEAGVYREKVTITEDKPFIFLEGEGREQTVIEWGAHASFSRETMMTPATTTAESATFTVYAGNFTARWITFKNTFAREDTWTKQAVAALIAGDSSSFHGCGFIGFQDTLSDLFGRHYFRDCYIEGAIDFIFGFGQSIYEKCTLFVVRNTVPGWITAQGRRGRRDPGGYVFNGCTVTGTGKAYLGRAWGPYARVLFYGTYMSDAVVPQGWDSWSYEGHERHLTFAEAGCSGPGSETSRRVYWEDGLRESQVRRFTDLRFIDSDGWLRRQPF